MGVAGLFGFVTANWKELSKEQQERYGSVYCGICREIRMQSSSAARITLSYDMAFLALLLMSLYEPEEQQGRQFCGLHPLKKRDWVDNPYIRYAADMNVALAYYKALDDYRDEKKPSAQILSAALESHYARIAEYYPRQCRAIAQCIQELSRLERENTANPDLPAACFGQLMAELMVFQEDLWQEPLRGLGFHLGRYIYLADAMLDYDRDRKHGSYNPFLACGQEKDSEKWDEYLVLAMGKCTEHYEKLPLVQDKALLDNILYSGVWVKYRGTRKEDHHG